MNAFLPHPFLSAGLILVWLLLNAPPTPGNVLLALLPRRLADTGPADGFTR